MDKQTAIDKIRKCLALAASAGEHEAATALRQARALMDKFNVTEQETLAATVSEARARAGAYRQPSSWETHLAIAVARAFECAHLFASAGGQGHWVFIGAGAAPEVAQYAFAVLLRQVKRERAAFVQHECKRLKPASKTRRADFFCLAWVHSVAQQVQDFAGQGRDDVAIAAYLDHTYGTALKQLNTRDRSGGAMRERDWDALSAGARSGKNAQLRHGVDSAGESQRLIGS